MTEDRFESLYEYQEPIKKVLVREALNEKDDSGPIGTIIDRGLSFIPRAMRFNKAKNMMVKALKAYDKKSRNIIQKFGTSISARADLIEKKYKEMLETKVKPAVENEEVEKAVKLMQSTMDEIKRYRDGAVQTLEKELQTVLDAYDKAIEKRIESPGFVINVELSEKGKGELRAKWHQLVASQKMNVEDYKAGIAMSGGTEKLSDIISEIEGFIEQNRYGAKAIDEFYINEIKKEHSGVWQIKVYMRSHTGRVKTVERGVIWAPDENQLETVKTSNKVSKSGGTSTFAVTIPKLKEEDFVRPYYILFKSVEPIFGDVVNVGQMWREGLKTVPKEEENIA